MGRALHRARGAFQVESGGNMGFRSREGWGGSPLTAAELANRSIVPVMKTIPAEDLVGEEWAEWYCLSPEERWLETCRLWDWFLKSGGSLDPEPDTQSPFFDPEARRQSPVDGRAGLRVVRRSGV